MTLNNSNSYGKIRKSCLRFWLKNTKRKRSKFQIDDDFSESYECRWQEKAENLGYNHISLFCSLGEWSSNISDLLFEDKYDQLNYENGDDCEVLFRIYTRYILIASEIIEDFISINAELKHIDIKDKNRCGRDFETSFYKKFETQRFSEFANKICKHKYNNIHIHNHHVPKVFDDIYSTKKLPNGAYWNFDYNYKIDINNITEIKGNMWQPNTTSCIIMPELKYLLGLIVRGYKKLDNLFNENPKYFKTICEKYDDKIF